MGQNGIDGSIYVASHWFARRVVSRFFLSLCVFPSVPLALFPCLPHEGNNLALFLITSLRCSFYLTLVVFMRSVSQCLHAVCAQFTRHVPRGCEKKMRILLTGISKKNVVLQQTFDAILAVAAWGLEHFAAGKRATCRHDRSPWQASDRKRAKQTASRPDLPVRACLAEVKCDWNVFKGCFNFPAWNTLAGTCITA